MPLFWGKKKKNENSDTVNDDGINIIESIDESIDETEDELVEDLIDESSNELIDKPIDEAFNEPVAELIDDSTDSPDGTDNSVKQSFFRKMFRGLDKTRKNIMGGIDRVLSSFVKIDDKLFDELEETLILADIGVETATKLISGLKERIKSERVTEVSQIKSLLADEINKMLGAGEEFRMPSPAVILVIGVNGAGKTTSIAKLANHYKREGKKVMLAAADTFRAAAIDQLEVWANRVSVPMIRQSEGSDPGAVIFDAVAAAKSKKMDILICDTAGRLHNKKNLMEELKKIYRIVNTQYSEATLEVFLVLDSTTGQNALSQAKLFKEAAPITGIILTKLDGTAKGGVILSICNELSVPVRFVGLGEGIEDIQPFDPVVYAKGILFDE